MPNATFYVYILRDPRPDKNSQPIYVGKGQRYRMGYHWRNIAIHSNVLLRNVLNKIHEAGLKPIEEKIQSFIVEKDAFEFEKELIALYGRRDLKQGSLCNLTNGGDGPAGSLAIAAHMRKLHTNPEFAKARDERGRIRFTKLFKDPKYKETHIERTRKQMVKQNANPEFKKKQSEGSSKSISIRNVDPEYQAKCIAGKEAKNKNAKEARLMKLVEKRIKAMDRAEKKLM